MFHTHGEHKLQFDEGILTVEARGPFNIEQIDYYKAALLSELENVSKPWAQLNTLHEDCLFTPQGEEEMYSTIKLRKDTGICAVAVFFIDGKPNSIAEQQLKRMYAIHDINYKCFKLKNEATAWLREQISKAMP
jgi:hypothetical protein